MKRKNYNSDFSIILTPKSIGGESLSAFPECDIRLVFECGGKKYICARESGKYINSSLNDDGTLTCIFDNHGLLPGVMKMSGSITLPDTSYPDGNKRIAIPVRYMDIELTNAGKDDAAEFSVDLVMPFAIITAYQMAVSAGYTGTEEDWIKLMMQGTEIKDNLSIDSLETKQIINTGNIYNGGNILTKDLKVTNKGTFKDIEVTGTMKVLDLDVLEAKVGGGVVVYSVGSAKIDSIEEIKDTSGNVTGWKCYQLAKDTDGTYVRQMLRQNDLAICATGNTGKGLSDGGITRAWWRKITSVTSTPETSATDGKEYISFSISKADCVSGSATPQAGDELYVLGNTSDSLRQNAIVVCAYKRFYDTDLGAPYIAQYKGINDFDLKSHRVSCIGWDTNEKPYNHLTGNFTVTRNDDIDTPVVRDLGEWKAGTYYYYDRVSYNGNLYLMTNKTAGTTTGVPGVSSDWTLQVSKGDKGENGASISIKGNAIMHIENATDIDTTIDGYILCDVGTQYSPAVCIVKDNSYSSEIQPSVGDGYVTSLDGGHLWTAGGLGEGWTDCGVIKGEKGDKGDKGDTGDKGSKGDKGDPGTDGSDGKDGIDGNDGADAEIYILVPNTESVSLGASGSVSGKLDYTAYLYKANTYTVQTLSDTLYWRWKTEKSTDGWHDVKAAGAVTIPSYTFESDKSDCIVVELIKDYAKADTRIVKITVSNDAFLEVNTEMGTIKMTAQAASDTATEAKTSTVALQGEMASMSTKVGNVEAEMSTSVVKKDSGGYISNAKIKADNIILQGYVTANQEFKIDEWGNVKTGTQYGVTTSKYIVEDKSNLIFTSDTAVTLPNDKEYIGRKIIIMSQPRHTSAGVVVDASGNAITDISSLPKVEITTGEVFVKGVYGISTQDGASAPSVVIEQADDSNSPMWGVKWFGGNCMFTQGSNYMQPSKLTLRGGYIELLGVSYSVLRVFRAQTGLLNDEYFRVHMARVGDDGVVTTSEPYSTVKTISDTDASNGTIDVLTGTQTSDAWASTSEMCMWTVVNVNAAELTKGLR